MPVNDSDFFVSITRGGSPEVRLEDPVAEARKAELRDFWSRTMALVHQPGEDDFEEFYEEAARLEAIDAAVGEGRVWLSQYSEGAARNLGTGEVVPLQAVHHLRRFGGQPPTRQTGVPELAYEKAIDRYHQFEAFTRNAGRPLITAGHDLEGAPGPELFDAIRDIAAQGFEKVVVKVTKAKRGFSVIDVRPDIRDDELTDVFHEDMEWALVREGGRAGAFLVQGFVPMRFEYRMFVVDGVVVTGAGCIEEHTPGNNRGVAFDTQVREHRICKSPVEDRPELVSKLLTFAQKVADEWTAERPDLRTTVIDVALGSDDEPLVVEFNGLLNSGLYSSDPRLVAAALAADERLPEVVDETFILRGATPVTEGSRMASVHAFAARLSGDEA